MWPFTARIAKPVPPIIYCPRCGKFRIAQGQPLEVGGKPSDHLFLADIGPIMFADHRLPTPLTCLDCGTSWKERIPKPRKARVTQSRPLPRRYR